MKHKTYKNFIKKIIPILYSLCVFIILSIAIYNYSNYTKGQWEKDERSNLMDLLASKKSNLEKALYSRIYYTRGVAAYVSLNPSISNNEFSELAKEYIKQDSVISTMALSKNCILNAIYPYEGHESAIGLNLLAHPERKEIVEKTIKTELTFIAGPVELIEGGTAFISYTPIFDKLNNNSFWGITDIVIKKENLIKEANINLEENGFKFALRGTDGTGKNGPVFWGDASIFENDPISIAVNLPIGNWVLAATPVNGWNSYLDQDKTILYILFISTFIISILIWFISKTLLKIKQNERKMVAIFKSIDSLIVEFNKDGDYLTVNYSNKDLLYKPQKDLIGKNVSTIFEPEMAKLFKNAITKCIKSKELVVLEYPLVINNKKMWFSARVTYKTPDTVILNAYDITDNKSKEEELKTLNKIKDQFFSIIAHDLKNPAGTQKSLINLLVDRFDTMDINKQKTMLKTIQKSSDHLYNLLEDLLNWSMSQSKKIIAKKIKFNIITHNKELFSQLENQANLKEITFINTINPENANVIGDPDLTSIIIRNLISNALKFTERNKKVEISSEIINYNQKQYFQLNITDTGIGISSEKIDDLFKIEKTQSNPGTENEKGSGLGLLLCKEFIEKQGGKITIESKIGVGSKFSILLPTE
ncbi:ATP-binding protein [Lutibacter sp. A80]|uniref:ATP-binding protein n=1 Tax=Lutibacter sp. A80 TaxID=2918453 RepID=UPI001F0587E6|nr:ATP-binding protein [Lutibacter sp. A80]UMB61637.1 ATP-binding protein [Lutibacter sp. A80]